jgi:hypothetical protein
MDCVCLECGSQVMSVSAAFPPRSSFFLFLQETVLTFNCRKINIQNNTSCKGEHNVTTCIFIVHKNLSAMSAYDHVTKLISYYSSHILLSVSHEKSSIYSDMVCFSSFSSF